MLNDKTRTRLKAEAAKRREKWLKKWDGNCLICGKSVEDTDLFQNGMPDSINGSVFGAYIGVYGHRTCVQNVDRIVVLPNRMMAISLMKK